VCPHQHATATHTFKYSSAKTATDANAAADSFGVETRGQLMLLPWTNFNDMATGLEGYVGAATAVQG
jgi:hypothetical protein